MLSIEFEAPDTQSCSCCGQDVTRLTRFVYQGGDALAYYYALLEAHSQPRAAMLLVVMCEWSAEGDHIVRKTGFPLRMWEGTDNFNFALLNKDECPWQDLPDVHILSRDKSLPHPMKAEVFHIADHIMAEDQAVLNYFSA